ncbi:hypothetical protein PENTCL1PPCAC_23362, partial [Pristionchus entomophagus]
LSFHFVLSRWKREVSPPFFSPFSSIIHSGYFLALTTGSRQDGITALHSRVRPGAYFLRSIAASGRQRRRFFLVVDVYRDLTGDGDGIGRRILCRRHGYRQPRMRLLRRRRPLLRLVGNPSLARLIHLTGGFE